MRKLAVALCLWTSLITVSEFGVTAKKPKESGGPGYAATVDYVVKAIDSFQYAPVPGVPQQLYTDAEVVGGVFKFKQTGVAGNGMDRHTSVISFKLDQLIHEVTADYNDESHTFGKHVLLKCRIGACINQVSLAEEQNPVHSAESFTETWILVDNDDAAESLAKAMSHLIALSGGKNRPF